MKIKNGYILRTVAGQNIVIPSNDICTAIKGALTLNETGTFIWKMLESGNTKEGLVKALTDQYDIDAATATASVERMTARLEKYGVLDR